MKKTTFYFTAFLVVLMIGQVHGVAAKGGNANEVSLYQMGKYNPSTPTMDFDLGVPRIIVQTVNNHAGFLAIIVPDGPLDQPFVFCSGYDNGFADIAPSYAQALYPLLAGTGLDLIVFEPLDAGQLLQYNAENLAVLIGDVLDPMFGAEYPLAVGGISAGGIYPRLMFVQENFDMGVDKYFSIDAPHKGAIFSNWAVSLASIFFTREGAQQMWTGTPEYDALFGMMEAAETPYFVHNRLGNVVKIAATAVNNDDNRWTVSEMDLLYHNVYFPVSSYIDTSALAPISSTTFIPYHSSAYLSSTDVILLGSGEYKYKQAHSAYFDAIVSPSQPDAIYPHDTAQMYAAGALGELMQQILAA